jgi:hypothetical protein
VSAIYFDFFQQLLYISRLSFDTLQKGTVAINQHSCNTAKRVVFLTVIQQLEKINRTERGSFFANVGNTDHDMSQAILAKMG